MKRREKNTERWLPTGVLWYKVDEASEMKHTHRKKEENQWCMNEFYLKKKKKEKPQTGNPLNWKKKKYIEKAEK